MTKGSPKPFCDSHAPIDVDVLPITRIMPEVFCFMASVSNATIMTLCLHSCKACPTYMELQRRIAKTHLT